MDEQPLLDMQEALTVEEHLTVKVWTKREKVIDYMSGESFPVGTPDKIKDSPNGGFYYDALKSGWSVRQLERYAKEHFGEAISRDCFSRLRRVVPTDQIIAQPIRDNMLQGIEAKIDCLQELHNIVEVQKKRTAMAMGYEQRVKDTMMLPAFMAPVREEVRMLWTMTKELMNLEVNLGIAKSEKNMPRFTGVSEEEDVTRRIVEGWTPEQRNSYLDFMRGMIKEEPKVIEIMPTEGSQVEQTV